MAVSQDAAHATTANKTASIPRLKATETRVASLERQLAQRNGDPGTPDSAKNSSNCDHDKAAFVSTTQASQPAPNNNTSEDDMDDLANALGCFTLGDIGELRYFGASSNFSIIHNHAIKVLELRTDPDDANTAGEAFAAHAKTMLHYQCEAPTTSTVQATALLGLYWATTDNEGLGFMYIGMATRMAMNLGLHCDCSPYTSKGLVSDDDVEASNVTFSGVYVLDK
ncbi:nitrogen assimilation transcription factor nirA [Fusarium sp. NRRL 52700]|nr:nitrogen assimilation transcription factor nirA [Fusarium sp. NRRL 52700]